MNLLYCSHKNFISGHQAMPCHLQEFHSILTLPTWSKHQTAEVKGSIPREGISHSLSFWPTSYRLGVPMTTSLGFIYLLRVAHRTQRNILFLRLLVYYKGHSPEMAISSEMHRARQRKACRASGFSPGASLSQRLQRFSHLSFGVLWGLHYTGIID